MYPESNTAYEELASPSKKPFTLFVCAAPVETPTTSAYLGECSDLWISDTDRYDAGDGQGIDIITPVVDGFTLLYTPFSTGFGNG